MKPRCLLIAKMPNLAASQQHGVGQRVFLTFWRYLLLIVDHFNCKVGEASGRKVQALSCHLSNVSYDDLIIRAVNYFLRTFHPHHTSFRSLGSFIFPIMLKRETRSRCRWQTAADEERTPRLRGKGNRDARPQAGTSARWRTAR